MLTLTRTAASMLIDTRDSQGMPDDAALRVAAVDDDDGQPGLVLGFVDQPFEGDQVGVVHGLWLCVDPVLTDVLDDASIDVLDEDGQPRLVLVHGS